MFILPIIISHLSAFVCNCLPQNSSRIFPIAHTHTCIHTARSFSTNVVDAAATGANHRTHISHFTRPPCMSVYGLVSVRAALFLSTRRRAHSHTHNTYTQSHTSHTARRKTHHHHHHHDHHHHHHTQSDTLTHIHAHTLTRILVQQQRELPLAPLATDRPPLLRSVDWCDFFSRFVDALSCSRYSSRAPRSHYRPPCSASHTKRKPSHTKKYTITKYRF